MDNDHDWHIGYTLIHAAEDIQRNGWNVHTARLWARCMLVLGFL